MYKIGRAINKTPNQIGWVTSLSVTQNVDTIEVSAIGDKYASYIPGLHTVEADLHIVAHDPGALMKQFQRWMDGGIGAPQYNEEYMCLYCASPNGIEHTHCKKCGAPRSFVIG